MEGTVESCRVLHSTIHCSKWEISLRPLADVSRCVFQPWTEACVLLAVLVVLTVLAVAVETLSGADSREGGRCFGEWDEDVQRDFVIIWHSSSPFITLDCSLHVRGEEKAEGLWFSAGCLVVDAVVGKMLRFWKQILLRASHFNFFPYALLAAPFCCELSWVYKNDPVSFALVT